MVRQRTAALVVGEIEGGVESWHWKSLQEGAGEFDAGQLQEEAADSGGGAASAPVSEGCPVGVGILIRWEAHSGSGGSTLTGEVPRRGGASGVDPVRSAALSRGVAALKRNEGGDSSSQRQFSRGRGGAIQIGREPITNLGAHA
ncbi:hypothetical protein OsI_06502 [Oryza sativa Indica Group]|uniref:Uncharacterized protein n=1 Tax=Oryza sativa subsp. indica TaxID=39946 RepID=B8AEM2_ORYSI|nr:hypothetical protein OsI_06502 [Oryza sativa Indica Group]